MDSGDEEATGSRYEYDAFLSYSTDPDYATARELERFLESFHTQVETLPDGSAPRALQVCRDGSDFSIAAFREEATGDDDAEARILNGLDRYLERSEYLIVLCSRGAAQSAYVEHEVAWFAERRPNNVLLVVTEGDDDATDVFPPSALSKGLAERPFYDLRGLRAEPRSPKTRDPEDAKVSIAAQLHGYSAGELLPIWVAEERRRDEERKRRRAEERYTLALPPGAAVRSSARSGSAGRVGGVVAARFGAQP